MRMGIGLGVGINRSNYAQGIFNAYSARVVADGGVVESGSCVDAVSSLLQSASLLLIPSGYKANKLYSEIPTNGNGDLTWTRTSTAIRTNSSGLLESMATGVPRLSYMYGSCPSALLEPQRTNLVLQSQDFDNASWTKVASSITANTTTSPDGSSNADKITASANNANHGIFNVAPGYTVASLVPYAYSCYAKKGNVDYLIIDHFQGSNALTWFNINDGTIGTTASGVTASIQSVGNGWYRCTCVKTITNTSNIYIGLYLSNANSTIQFNATGNEFIYLFGAQIEAGSYQTTYIPTTSATATRVADSFSRNNIYTNGLISASGGTWFVELRGNVAYVRDSSSNGFGIGDSSSLATNSIFLRLDQLTSARLAILKRIAGIPYTLYTTTTDTTKIAIKWNGTSADIFVNGVKEISATAFTTTNMDFLAVGSAFGVGVPIFIQQMALFPTPLSDTDCTTITSI